jgi:hypothetical protein
VRRGPEVVVVALAAGIVAAVVAMVVMVLSHPAPPPPVSAPPSTPSSAAPEPPGPDLPDGVDYPLPDVGDLPLGRAVVALERAGATVVSFEAGGGERSVQPDWDVCTASELFRGDTPTGEIHLAAVPPGDTCP